MVPVQSEAQVQELVCDYIRLTYPGLIFNSDGAGNNLSYTQAAKNTRLRSSSGYPDLFIACPRGKYHGLFLELKRADARVFLKNGRLSTDPHIVAQEAVLQALQDAGYAADFAIGLDEAVTKLDWYMKQ